MVERVIDPGFYAAVKYIGEIGLLLEGTRRRQLRSVRAIVHYLPTAPLKRPLG